MSLETFVFFPTRDRAPTFSPVARPAARAGRSSQRQHPDPRDISIYPDPRQQRVAGMKRPLCRGDVGRPMFVRILVKAEE